MKKIIYKSNDAKTTFAKKKAIVENNYFLKNYEKNEVSQIKSNLKIQIN